MIIAIIIIFINIWAVPGEGSGQDSLKNGTRIMGKFASAQECERIATYNQSLHF